MRIILGQASADVVTTVLNVLRKAGISSVVSETDEDDRYDRLVLVEPEDVPLALELLRRLGIAAWAG
jgi:hypothetical protein